ncbi:MAG TPA: tRNA methyltransferase, partial [Erythrobacter sp.]|nr:tRNA methyltransferase [Erythrobacter sp.]
LLFGKESAGVTDAVRAVVDASVRLPMRAEVRSLNLATSAGMALGEALRQTQGLPG